MEGREGCLGIFLGMFIVCPARMSRAEEGQGMEPPGMAPCPQHHKPALCVFTSQESRNHPVPIHHQIHVCYRPCGGSHGTTTALPPSPYPRISCLGSLPMALIGNQAPVAPASVLTCFGCRGRGRLRLLGIHQHYPELVLVLCR